MPQGLPLDCNLRNPPKHEKLKADPIVASNLVLSRNVGL